MTWLYNGEEYNPEEAPKEYQGFVYRITEIDTGMKYIGKKFFWSRRTLPPLKGKKRKRKVVKESDWRDYYGSSKQLNETIEVNGKDRYKREILIMCETKGECTYHEARLQFKFDVLLRDDYYNGQIQCRIHASHIKGDYDDDQDPTE